MKNKSLIGLSIAIIAIVAIGGVALASNYDNNNEQASKEIITTFEEKSSFNQANETVIDNQEISNDYGSNLSEGIYQNMTQLMSNNGFEEMTQYMENGNYDAMTEFMNNISEEDYEQMIKIMNENGYEYMGQMMESIGIDEMVNMHNSMHGSRTNMMK